MKKFKNLNTFLLIIIFLLVIFENVLPNAFSYVDEAFSLLCFIYICFALFFDKKSIKKSSFVMIISYFCFFVIGIISNYLFKVQIVKSAWFIDAFTISKIFWVFIFVVEFVDFLTIKKVLRFLYPAASLYVICASVFYLLMIFFKLPMYGESRYGLYSFQFISSNPSIFGYSLMAFLPAFFFKKNNFSKIMIFLSLLLMALTTKGPQLIYVVIFPLLFFYYARHKKINIIFCLLLLLFGIIAGHYQIQTYLFNNNSPRYILIKYSIETAKHYFPFGSGFATYGSEMSRIHYSPLYIKYGFDSIWGLSLANSSYINDNYWPMILAQNGVFGLGFIIVNYCVIYSLLSKIENRTLKTYCMTTFIIFLVGSIGASYLKSSIGVICFFMISILYKVDILKANSKELKIYNEKL